MQNLLKTHSGAGKRCLSSYMYSKIKRNSRWTLPAETDGRPDQGYKLTENDDHDSNHRVSDFYKPIFYVPIRDS